MKKKNIQKTPYNLDNSERKVESLVNEPVSTISHSPIREVMMVKQVADYLGLSKSTIYSHVSKRTIPFCKRNGTVYFLQSSLLKWLKEGEKATIHSLIHQ
jgi:excisionase family DNA binding protein